MDILTIVTAIGGIITAAIGYLAMRETLKNGESDA